MWGRVRTGENDIPCMHTCGAPVEMNVGEVLGVTDAQDGETNGGDEAKDD